MKFIVHCLIACCMLISGQVFGAPNIAVTFVLDESGSISASNFQLENQGFINALNGLPTDGSVEVSIMGFASSSQVLRVPTVLTAANFNSVKSSLENNTQSSGGTNMSDAINTAAGLLSPSPAPTRVICLSTDGAPSNASATTTAANNAKNAGIRLSPIGIGLNTSGKTFLDSIASTPPVPNPTNFTEFSTVVRNVCVGVVESALNIQLEPDPVDFGVYDANTDTVCNGKQTIGLSNNSDQSVAIKEVKIIGEDAGDFKILNIAGTPIGQVNYPFSLPPLYQTTIDVELMAVQSPADSSYDASLVVVADDHGQDVEFSTTVTAEYIADNGGCLSVKVIDASPVISRISSNGEPLVLISPELPLTESHVVLAVQLFNKMAGLVADGNARLLLNAKTPGQTNGKIRFRIIQPTQTEATLYKVDRAPTYNSNGEYDTSGETVKDVDIDDADGDSVGSATVILRAGERFGGLQSDPDIKFTMEICVLNGNDCDSSKVAPPVILTEHRAPVLLIHGLWADNDSWRDDDDNQHGLFPELMTKGFIVDRYQYDGNLGPVHTVPTNKSEVQDSISQLCSTYIIKDIACTRVDIVAHSMGGLFAREFIRQNFHNLDRLNRKSYNQGTIRRLITLGTPHTGSPLANLLHAGVLYNLLDDEENNDTSDDVDLVANNAFIGDCIIHPEVNEGKDSSPPLDTDPDGGYNEIKDLIKNLARKPNFKFVDSGIRDLAVGSNFLDRLNSSVVNIQTFLLTGNIGEIYDQSLTTGRTIFGTTNRAHLIGNAEKAGCDYDDVLVDDSDGIVPVDSARYLSSFAAKYIDQDLNTYNYLDEVHSEAITAIFHTGMGKLHSKLNEKREEDITKPESRVIDNVLDLLHAPLIFPDGSGLAFSRRI